MGKDEAKQSLFTENMVLYIEKSKDSTKKLLDIINEFSKVAGNKIDILKSVAFCTPILNCQKEKLRN